MSNVSSGNLSVNTIGLIVGITVVSTVLIAVLIAVVIVVCRKRVRRDKRDLDRSRSGAYILPNGSPYGIGSTIPSPMKQDSFGHASDKSLVGNFRPNPLAENPFQRSFIPQQGVSMVNLPGNGYNNKDYSGQHRGNSMQALNSAHDNQTFFASLYEKLSDTVHQDRGRPLYVCSKADYTKLSDYFDIVGKTRHGEWLVRPRPNVPDRPTTKHVDKKPKAPQPHGSGGSKPSKSSHERRRKDNEHHKNSSEIRRGRSFLENQAAGYGRSVITTPFGAAHRGQYFSGSHINLDSQVHLDQQRYTSLPRDGKYVSTSNDNGARAAKVERSNSAATQSTQMNEQVYTNVVSKNAISHQRTNGVEIKGKAQVYTIEESPKLQRKSSRDARLDSISATSPPHHRERSGSTSTQKSLGITDQFKFLDDIQYSDEKF